MTKVQKTEFNITIEDDDGTEFDIGIREILVKCEEAGRHLIYIDGRQLEILAGKPDDVVFRWVGGGIEVITPRGYGHRWLEREDEDADSGD